MGDATGGRRKRLRRIEDFLPVGLDPVRLQPGRCAQQAEEQMEREAAERGLLREFHEGMAKKRERRQKLAEDVKAALPAASRLLHASSSASPASAPAPGSASASSASAPALASAPAVPPSSPSWRWGRQKKARVDDGLAGPASQGNEEGSGELTSAKKGKKKETAQYEALDLEEPVAIPDDEDSERAAFRAACRKAPSGKEIKAINGPYYGSSTEGATYYAKCKSDKDCKYKFQGIVKDGRVVVLGKGEHAEEPAVVRQDAANPLTKPALAAIHEKVKELGAEKTTPEEVFDKLEGTAAQDAPGEAVRNILKRTRRKARKFLGYKHRFASVEGLDSFCEQREVQLDSENPTIPDPSSLTVYRLGSRPHHRLPCISANEVVVLFGLWAWVLRAVALLQDNPGGLIGQADFVFKVVWNGLALGVLGCQLYHKVHGRWKKTFLPLVMVLGVTEDTSHYGLMYEVATLLVHIGCATMETGYPKQLFRQIHSDFADAAVRAAKLWFTGSVVVQDLEHLFRNLRKHQGQESRLKHYDIGIDVCS